MSRWVAIVPVFILWTLLALVFASLSYAISVSNGMKADINMAVAQHPVRYYVWAILSFFILRFSRRFRLEQRAFRLRRLFVHLPAILAFAIIHHLLFAALLWFPGIAGVYRATSFYGFYKSTLQPLFRRSDGQKKVHHPARRTLAQGRSAEDRDFHWQAHLHRRRAHRGPL